MDCWPVLYLICMCTGVWNLGEEYRWTWFRGGVVWCGSEVSVRWHCSETCWSLEPSTPESHLEVLPFIPSFKWSVDHFTNRSSPLRIIPLKFFLSQSIYCQLMWWQVTNKSVATTSKPVNPHWKWSDGLLDFPKVCKCKTSWIHEI